MLFQVLGFCIWLEADGNAQELHVAVAIPDQQLLPRCDLFAALIEDLALALQGCQVLLLWEAGTVDQGHPVAKGALAINEVAQAPFLKDLQGDDNVHCKPLPTCPAGDPLALGPWDNLHLLTSSRTILTWEAFQ